MELTETNVKNTPNCQVHSPDLIIFIENKCSRRVHCPQTVKWMGVLFVHSIHRNKEDFFVWPPTFDQSVPPPVSWKTWLGSRKNDVTRRNPCEPHLTLWFNTLFLISFSTSPTPIDNTTLYDRSWPPRLWPSPPHMTFDNMSRRKGTETLKCKIFIPEDFVSLNGLRYVDW